jgi:subtilisin family serine protease
MCGTQRVTQRLRRPSFEQDPSPAGKTEKQMHYFKRSRRLSLIAITVAVMAVSGCTDSFTGPNEPDTPATRTETGDKFRHADLMNRAIRAGTNQVAGKNHTALGLIFKINKQRVMERYKILERYRIFERYKLMERYEYSAAFDGFAVTFEDTTGGSEFSLVISALQADTDIEWFEPDFAVETPVSSELAGQTGQTIPWSVAYVGAKTSSTISGDGSGSVDVDVYVIDTGVSNDDLNITEAIDFRDTLGTGIVDPNDYDGHGTHVSGVIAASDNTIGLVGIAPGARIHNLKVLGDDGTTDVSVVIAAIEYIIKAREANPATPMVVNMSLGENIGSTSYTALDEAVEQLTTLGVTVVVAAGNQGVDAALVTPAHVASVITVGAHDKDGYFAAFSNWGAPVDILAPGVDVISLSPSIGGVGAPLQMTGTSMAAPHVAGAAALYLSQNPAASPAQVEAALLAAAKGGIKLTGPKTVGKSLWVGGF